MWVEKSGHGHHYERSGILKSIGGIQRSGRLTSRWTGAADSRFVFFDQYSSAARSTPPLGACRCRVIMKNRVLILTMILLTAVVLQTAIRIEILNAKAGYYLPRTDFTPDTAFPDGKWRISGENGPRDQLRDVVQTFGLIQYALAPFLLILAILVAWRSRRLWAKVVGTASIISVIAAIWLMLHREYFQSLEW